jgi:hypothetical protein
MTTTKPDLASLIASEAGSTRQRPKLEQPRAANAPREPKRTKPVGQGTRAGTSPITVHFPRQVRNQLKILAVNNSTTMQNLVAEAFNDLFAKYGKPEIAPKE